MKYDSTTPDHEMLWELGDYQFGGYNEDAVNEFRRRSELAAKYERLTQALGSIRDALVIDDGGVFACELWNGDMGPVTSKAAHDGTPDSIADAIIAAAEAAQ